MSLPLFAPPQLLYPDDVLPVEVLGDGDTAAQDIREHLGVEHFVGSDVDSTHRVILIPVAIATVLLDNDRTFRPERFRVAHQVGFIDPPSFWGDGFRWVAPSRWLYSAVSVRSSRATHAFGWTRWKDRIDPSRGGVSHDNISTVRHIEGITVALFGIK